MGHEEDDVQQASEQQQVQQENTKSERLLHVLLKHLRLQRSQLFTSLQVGVRRCRRNILEKNQVSAPQKSKLGLLLAMRLREQ